MKYPEPLQKLIHQLRKLPGVGQRSAERFAFQLTDWTPQELKDMGKVLAELPEKLLTCSQCGCLCDSRDCAYCHSARRDAAALCIVACPKDVFPIEETSGFRGLYHVLGVTLSPMDGRGPEDLDVSRIRARIQDNRITEVIIALDSTLEGDATALYLKEALKDLPVNLSRIAFGIPMGSSLDYVDGGTLAQAFVGRRGF